MIVHGDVAEINVRQRGSEPELTQDHHSVPGGPALVCRSGLIALSSRNTALFFHHHVLAGRRNRQFFRCLFHRYRSVNCRRAIEQLDTGVFRKLQPARNRLLVVFLTLFRWDRQVLVQVIHRLAVRWQILDQLIHTQLHHILWIKAIKQGA